MMDASITRVLLPPAPETSMKTSPLLAAALLLVPMSMFAREGDRDARDDRERFAAALEIELIEIGPADAPDADGIARVTRATGEKESALAGGDYYWGLFGKSGEEMAVHLVRKPVSNLGAAAAVIMALDENGAFAAAAVVNEKDEAIESWGNLAHNLRFAELPKLGDAKPRSELVRIRKRSATEKTEDGRLTLALLDVLVHMNEQASSFNIPDGTNPLSDEEQARMMSEQYTRVAELSEMLEPLLGDRAELFAEIGRESAAIALDIAEGKGNQRALFGNCRRCHDMELPGGTVKEVFEKTRRGFGIGDGFYQIGHDVRISHADREAAQRVADAMRSSALLLQAAE